MNKRSVKWAVALTVSAALHAAAAALLLPDMDAPKIEGGAPSEIAMAGDAFVDQIAAGEASDAVQPVTEAAAQAEPVETTASTELTQPIDAERLQAAEPAAPKQVMPTNSSTMPAAQPDAAQAAPAAAPVETAIVPSEARPAVEDTKPADIATAKHTDPVKQETVPALTVEPGTAESVDSAVAPAETAQLADALKPATPENTVQALADVPRPTPRPDYTPPERREPRPKPQQEKSRDAPVRKTSESNGRDHDDRRRGTRDGGAEGRSAADAQRKVRAAAAGNAAVSNYPGKVVRQLRRALRYPSGSDARGETQVRFTVSSNGAVRGIRVVRSSGSRVLDAAAIATVRRAAPFPGIPAAAGRSSWAFTVPVAFVR